MEKVRERLRRVTAALNTADVPYAVIGGNAVAAWVSRVDESAVRNTQDVDILIRRADLAGVQSALESVGFIYRKVGPITMFLDGPDAKARDAVHVIFAGEKVRPEYDVSSPEIEEREVSGEMTVVALEALVRMKLTANRRKDQVHILDMISVGLIDATWPSRFPSELADRLQELLDTPDG